MSAILARPLLVAFLNRRSTVPVRPFVRAAAALVALSCIAPIALADNAVGTIAHVSSRHVTG